MTKYRHGVLNDDMLRNCQDVMRKVCSSFGAELREFNREHDHVHLLVSYPPTIAVPALVNSRKDVSARMLHAEFTGRVNRGLHARALLVSVLLRRILRSRTAEHHPAVHRAAEAAGLTPP